MKSFLRGLTLFCSHRTVRKGELVEAGLFLPTISANIIIYAMTNRTLPWWIWCFINYPWLTSWLWHVNWFIVNSVHMIPLIILTQPILLNHHKEYAKPLRHHHIEELFTLLALCEESIGQRRIPLTKVHKWWAALILCFMLNWINTGLDGDLRRCDAHDFINITVSNNLRFHCIISSLIRLPSGLVRTDKRWGQ